MSLVNGFIFWIAIQITIQNHECYLDPDPYNFVLCKWGMTVNKLCTVKYTNRTTNKQQKLIDMCVRKITHYYLYRQKIIDPFVIISSGTSNTRLDK